MRHHRPHLTKFFSMLALGLAMTAVGCDDQNQASDNLLTNPGAAKHAVNTVEASIIATSSDEVVPIRELITNNTMAPVQQQGKDPGDQLPPQQPGFWMHEKVPEHTKLFWVTHDPQSNYRENNGTVWYHVTQGEWASKYSTNPNGPGLPTRTVHIVDGPDATRTITLWHITYGPDQTKYYDPTGNYVWGHIPTGPDASRYTWRPSVAPTPPTTDIDAPGHGN